MTSAAPSAMASRVAGSPTPLLDRAASSFLSGRPTLSSSSTSFFRGSASRSRGGLSSKNRGASPSRISKKGVPLVKARIALAPALRSVELMTQHQRLRNVDLVTQHPCGSVVVLKAPPALRSIKRLISAVAARPAASRTDSGETSAGENEDRDATAATPVGGPSELIRQHVEEPQSAAVEAIVLPHLPSGFALPTPRLNRRALLGFSVAALGAATAAELGLVGAAAAEAGKAKSKSPLWFLGEASGGGVSVDGGAKGGAQGGAPAAAKGPESRVYDATAVGEPALMGDKEGVWQRLAAARVVYLGEAEMVRDPTDKVVALEIVRRLRDDCFKAGRPVTLALSAFPRTTQPLLDKYLGKRLSEEDLQVAVSHWSKGRFEEMVPLLRYCRDSGVRLFACGVPPKILRTVQAGGVQALAPIDRQRYAPPLGGFAPPSPTSSSLPSATTDPPSATAAGATGATGSGLWGLEPAAVAAEVYSREAVSRTSLPFGPGPYWFAQARVVEQHAMARSIDQAMADGGIVGLLVVLTGASQVRYGAQGTGVPARINNGQLKTSAASQRIVLLNPERQRSRADSELPEADFFWYSGSRMCTHNCFDRAEIARVMGAAGRTFDNLPQDLQTGIERGLISPDTLRSFFELESHPLVAEATKRFQGLRERVYADPRFLQRIVTEEAISITTAMLAQWEKRRERFWSEIEYVATDVLRGTIVNFFTVWLPAPTLSFTSSTAVSTLAGSAAAGAAAGAAGAAGAAQGPVQQALGGVSAWAATLPKNAFQRATQPGQVWGLQERLASILFTSGKLFTVGFSASVGTVALNNLFMEVKNRLADMSAAAGAAGAAAGGNASAVLPAAASSSGVVQRSPVLKTAAVYGGFLATSANLRYQVIGGVVEHWIADYYLAANPMAGAALSFVARTVNSYWGTSQWVDLARFCGLQTTASQSSSSSDAASANALPAASAEAAATAAAEAAAASAAAAAALEQAYSASPSGFPALTPIPVLVNSPLYAAASAGVPAFEAWQYAAPAAAAAEAAADRAVAAERVAAAEAAAEVAEVVAEKAAAAKAAAEESVEAESLVQDDSDSELLPLGIPALPEQISSFSVSESGEALSPATAAQLLEEPHQAAATDALVDSPQESLLGVLAETEATGVQDKDALFEAVELSVPSSPPMGALISLEPVSMSGEVELLPSLDDSVSPQFPSLDSVPLADALSYLDSLPTLDSLPSLDSIPSLDSLASCDSRSESKPLDAEDEAVSASVIEPGVVMVAVDDPAVAVLGVQSASVLTAAAVPAAAAAAAAAAGAGSEPAAVLKALGSTPGDEKFCPPRDAVCA
ncbi:hypothetical protein CLOM_g1890 [Closterium sp. NIES-68]|nr:hypothetical protein CLOM_g1890 [Closterium sp. NIES-68]GJP82528.1 hypothetical protein CLOP_g12774 [Closterium sp. NIES-67]